MKILFVTFEFGEHVLGGLGRVINGLTQELRHHLVVDVYHIYFDPKIMSISAKVYRCDKNSYGKLIAKYPFRYGTSLIRHVKNEKYDLIQFFSVHWIIGNIINRVNKELSDLKIVYSIHSLIKYEKGIRLNPNSFFKCEQKLIESASSIHVLNKTSFDYLKSSYDELSVQKNVAIIPNGVNLDDFYEDDMQFRRKIKGKLKDHVFVVSCMSRWAHGKGLEYFLDAAEILLKKGRRVQFILGGRKWISWEMKWYSYMWKIDKAAKRIKDGVIILDWLNSTQRNTLFSLSDVFIMPSELEYFPYSILEPAAAGVPIISSDIPCVREMLTDKECLFFQPGNSNDLAAKIELLMDSAELGWKLAERAKKRVVRECDWKNIASQYVDMYQLVADSTDKQVVKLV
ncbi:MAG: glycosyltransferase family 4 protein [Sporocytophaga sp.]|uniref:glycosyltransferase family 4 protein n=1 Tax=Sporocytophaga sp. TaxID=2231183 RepID=UPI001B055EEB|nr:glycosyltransferase family 4 protein [Sporocytophaga sp.]MBO9702734.1 glycosyltransferase family 4 protein [Sporocytophaga sp.]